MAIAARIPMIATTIISSIRVNPFFPFNMVFSFPLRVIIFLTSTKATLVPHSRSEVVDVVNQVIPFADVPDADRGVGIDIAPPVGGERDGRRLAHRRTE